MASTYSFDAFFLIRKTPFLLVSYSPCFAILLAMQRTLLPSDYFQIENERPLSNVDVELLTDLYLPIIGANALAVYLKLFRFKEDRKRSHANLFEGLGMSSGNFLSARRKLEGIGLLETKLLPDSNDSFQSYLYVLNPPISGKKFLSSANLRKQLEKASSEDVLGWCDVVYKLTNAKRKQGGKDITENFSDVYHSEEALSTKELMSGISKSRRAIKTYFNVEKMVDFLKEKNPCYNMNFFSREELVEIEDLSSAHHYSEEAAADILDSSIKVNAPKGKRVDFKAFKKDLIADSSFSYLKASEEEISQNAKIIGDSDAAKSLREMERLSPEQFLIKKQGGGKLAPSDLLLIESLREQNLKDCVINALLDYVLEMQDGSLPRAYATKIAGSLARKRYDNPVDAFNYLRKDNGKKAKPATEVIIENEDTERDVKEEDDESLLDMFEEE